MATTYSWGYTNNTESDVSVKLIELGLVSDYGKKTTTADQCLLSNTTSPVDQPELIRFDFESQKVSTQDIANPAKSRDGVRFVSTCKGIQRETRDNGDVFDHPIQSSISIKLGTANNWSNEDVLESVMRTLSSYYDFTANEWKFEKMMRSALEPVED